MNVFCSRVGFFVLTSLLVFSSRTFAVRLSEGKSHVKIVSNQIYCSVDKGFHFNKDAPASLQLSNDGAQIAPIKKEEIEIVFDSNKIYKKTFTLNFYICDDQKTVCEPHEETYKNENGQLVQVTAENRKSASPINSVTNITAIDGHGFLTNDFQGALNQARKEKKLVLVDFEAPWCPACIRLETEVFGQADFKKATQKLVKLSINIDLLQNKALSDRYAVKAIPSLILMDSEGNEVYRSLDFKPHSILAKELTQRLNQPIVSYNSLKIEAEAGNKKAMAMLGLKAFNTLDFAEAVKWLAPLKNEQLLFANSEVSYWAEKSEAEPKFKKDYLNVLEKWIMIFPNTYEAIVWRTEYAHQVSVEGQPLKPAVRALLETSVQEIQRAQKNNISAKRFFEKTYQGDLTGFENIELNAQLAEIYELFADDTKKNLANQALAESVHKINLSVTRPGELVTALHYLGKAGLKQEVISWNEKLIQTFPNTFVYYMRLARYYMSEKEYVKALPLAQKGVELGPELALVNMQALAKIQVGLNQKAEAKATVSKALALPEAKLESYKRQTTALQELQKTL